jgi:hypothetical protein
MLRSGGTNVVRTDSYLSSPKFYGSSLTSPHHTGDTPEDASFFLPRSSHPVQREALEPVESRSDIKLTHTPSPSLLASPRVNMALACAHVNRRSSSSFGVDDREEGYGGGEG